MSHKRVAVFQRNSGHRAVADNWNIETAREGTAHEEAVTRVLGAPPDLIKVADVDIYRRWFEA